MATPVSVQKVKVFDGGNHFVRIFELFRRLNFERDQKTMQATFNVLQQLKSNKQDLMSTYFSFLSGMGIPTFPVTPPVTPAPSPSEPDPLDEIEPAPIPDIYIPMPGIQDSNDLPDVVPIPNPIIDSVPNPKITPIPNPVIEPIPDQPTPAPGPSPVPAPAPIPEPVPIPIPDPAPEPDPVPPPDIQPIPDPVPTPQPNDGGVCPLTPVCKLAPAFCPNCPLKAMIMDLFSPQVFDAEDDGQEFESENEIRLTEDRKETKQKKSWLDNEIPSLKTIGSFLKSWLSPRK